MNAQPGTQEYRTHILTELAAARRAAGLAATPHRLTLTSDFASIAAEITFGDSVAAHRINQMITAHNAAVDAAKQAKINARQAAATRAASCGTCFTVHAGDCY